MRNGKLNKQICHELPPANLIFTSKKLIVSFKCSAVNFIVGLKLFNLLRNFSRDSSPYSQMPSIYVNYIIGFPSKTLGIFSFKSAITKIAYGGANFVPIVVLRTCLKVFLSNSKMLFLSTISASSIRVSLEICFLSLNSKNIQRKVRPSLHGMLG